MDFTSYEMVGTNVASLNTGSYLNDTEYSLFMNGFSTDVWYSFSVNDAMEIGIWDRTKNFIGWNTLNQSKSYNEITLSYLNTLDFPTIYSYTELNPDFTLYKNEKILVNPAEQLYSTLGISSGSYFLTYNFIREMAGSINEPIIIKEISPSRKELKLVPIGQATRTYTAFCKKNILLKDISSLYISSIKDCPYDQIYKQIKLQYKSQINTIKSLFFLTSDGATINFLKNLYEDFIIYTTIPKTSTYESFSSNDRLIRIQGIRTYFINFLLSNSNNILDFIDVDNTFNGFVSASIERKFSPIGKQLSSQYIDAKTFIYDFFTKHFYQSISTTLATLYTEKYFSPLKNAINLGNNKLFPIISSGMIDERIDATDPLTLLLKLKSELPNDIMAQSHCWVSNISIVPYIINVIIKSPNEIAVQKIGPPNFSIPIPNASLTNTNLSYTAADLKENDATERELTIRRNIGELAVDYTNFSNFVVFSSAELRLKIFKNKIINLSNLNSSLKLLDDKNLSFMGTNGTSYPFYTQEYTSLQKQTTDIINLFDGYESYLYKSGNYTYIGGNFISSSYIDNMDISASVYDKNNRDSLINNCPSYILTNSDYDEYIVFLSMVGNFFDEIYIYISNLPSEKKIGHSATEEFTRRIVDYMLEMFGWNLDDSIEQTNLINNYLSSDQQDGLNSISAEDRLKSFRNRILINLPQIYKTKGTEESVKLILACYGIPSSLLSIREYGGVNYMDSIAAYTAYERVFMRQWNTSSINDTYYVQYPTGSNTFLFKLSIDDASLYTYNIEQTLFGNVIPGSDPSTTAGAGEWAIGFVRLPLKNSGKIFFRLGRNDKEPFKMYSPTIPLFDGNIYSVMIRRNEPDPSFDFTPIIDVVPTKYDLYVQRNEYGNKILQVTTSNICYNTESNSKFSGGGYINIGGWFSYQNGQGYTGTFDKFQIWMDALPDINFEDYVNSINAYSFYGSHIPHESLVFRMHTEYPFDQRQLAPIQNEVYYNIPSTDWMGIWRNGNSFYATGSSITLNKLYGQQGTNVDYMVNVGAWVGNQELVYNTQSCQYYSQSTYPFQFKVIDYPSTWPVSKYGPNKFRNEKVRHISQSIEARFDDKSRSTYVSTNDTAPDSNQVGFFVDPHDFKNRDIIRYFGNFDFMDAIGDPSYQFSENYNTLKNFRKIYAEAHTENSGSRTLFNELCILYKLYFNRSIFDAIKNIVPARTNALVGVLIEPTVLERSKYQAKPLSSETNTGSVQYLDATLLHYCNDPNTKLFNFTTSFNTNYNINLNTSYLVLPTQDYAVNYGGNYISDTSGKYDFGHFAGGFLSTQELQSLILSPTVNFRGNPLNGYPRIVTFLNLCVNATSLLWNFGDGTQLTTTTETSVQHEYIIPGLYTVSLVAYNGPTFITSNVKQNYIEVKDPDLISVNFTTNVTSGNKPLTVVFTNTSVNTSTYTWEFGDGYYSNDVNPSHVYSTEGSFIVKLTGSGKNQTEMKTMAITVSVLTISVNFTTNTISGIIPLSVKFTNTSINTDTYLWEFGDGATSNSNIKELFHIYTTIGNYSVKLTGRNTDTGQIATKVISISVSDIPMVVDFSPIAKVNPYLSTGGYFINFYNLSHGADTYKWDFGDGSTSTDTNPPLHTYHSENYYQYSLTGYKGGISSVKNGYIAIYNSAVNSGTKKSDTATTTFPRVYLVNLSSETGNVLFHYNPDNIPNKFIVKYDNEDVINTGYVGATSYQTTLNNALLAKNLPLETISSNSSGNGTLFFKKSTSTTQAIVLVYSPIIKDGSTSDGYDFTLDGVSRVKADFSTDILSGKGTAPCKVIFTNKSINADTYLWDFGDGTTSNLQNPTHTYAIGGTYTIVLTTTNALTHDSNTISISYVVNSIIFKVDYTPLTIISQVTKGVTFTNKSSNISSYLWNFGDGITNITSTPGTHIYSTQGFYSTSLTGTTADAQIAVTTGNIMVYSKMVSCGTIINVVSTDTSFPVVNAVTLSNILGQVKLDFNSNGSPMKFIVMYDNYPVINTGYVGHSSYQNDLNAALFDRGLPPETIVDSSILGGGQSGLGSITFGKGTTTSTAIVMIYNPLGHDGTYKLNCVSGVYIAP